MATLEILRTGPLALVQDLGRPGFAHLGVTRSGAADRRAHTLANRLLANPDDRATIEVTMGGLAARVRGGDLDIAVTGADTHATVGSTRFGANSIQRLRDGDVVALGVPHTGLRSYLAVRGGILATAVLGSRSYDVLARIGPPPLQPGDTIAIGEPAERYPELDQAPVASIDGRSVSLTVMPGPHDDRLLDADALTRAYWTASDHSDRVGMRLQGPPLRQRDPSLQLPSEGTVRGAIQLPPNGLPVILGPDHPITGGYPVVGVVVDGDIDKVAQIRPGQPVRLAWTRPGTLAADRPTW